MLAGLALLSLAIWIVLAFFWHGFWRADVVLDTDTPTPAAWPSVNALVPARNEAKTIAATVASLLAQNYPGQFRIVVTDDSSEDDTGNLALAEANGNPALTVTDARPLPANWAGKVWALSEAAAAAGEPDYFWLTDADIVHEPAVLAGLVAAAEAGRLDLASELVRLRCQSFWERLLVPAYCYFFALFYPFRAVADPASGIAGAAGGSILLRRRALAAIGGFEAMRGAIIDDCALAAKVKAAGGRIALGLARRSYSLRAYERLDEFWAMVKRSAYSQLSFSPFLVLATLAFLTLSFAGPPLLALAGLAEGKITAALAATVAAVLMWWTYRPSVRHCGLGAPWALTLPVTAMLYAAMTLASALAHHSGRDNRWRGRNIATK